MNAIWKPVGLVLATFAGFQLGADSTPRDSLRSSEAPTTLRAAPQESGRAMHRYMLEGVATPAVFAALIKAPEDRAENARRLFAKVGCELVDYYVGTQNFKSYVIMDCPDEDALASLMLALYASDTFRDATVTRIVSSAQLVDVAKDAQELAGSHHTPK